MSEKLLITGSTGFIGGFLVEAAIKRGYEVWAGIRKTSNKKYLQNPKTNFIEIDFEDEASLRSILKTHKFDRIIHNAGVTKTKREEDYIRINKGYLERFVRILTEEKILPYNFIYTSSIASMGPADFTKDKLVTNQSIPRPVTNYGKSKMLAEAFLNNETSKFPFTIIRPTAVYGPREKDLYTVFELVKRGLELYIGHQKQALTFIHVEDLVEIFMRAIEKNGERKAYFVADGGVYSAEELNGFIKNAMNKKTLKIRLPIALIKGIAGISEFLSGLVGKYPPLNRDKINELKCQSWVIDTSGIQEDFNFAPRYNLEEGIIHTVKWYKVNNWL